MADLESVRAWAKECLSHQGMDGPIVPTGENDVQVTTGKDPRSQDLPFELLGHPVATGDHPVQGPNQPLVADFVSFVTFNHFPHELTIQKDGR